jgi:hypothetical protein
MSSELEVPLVVPRSRKLRNKGLFPITVSTGATSTSDSASSPCPVGPSELMKRVSKEALTIRPGVAFDPHVEPVKFRQYALYRYGTHHTHCRSVGYSSDGDLVLSREQVSRGAADSLGIGAPVASRIDGAVCLVQGEKRGFSVSDHEGVVKEAMLPKYPGVKVPKSRRNRNRLRNDHLLTPEAVRRCAGVEPPTAVSRSATIDEDQLSVGAGDICGETASVQRTEDAFAVCSKGPVFPSFEEIRPKFLEADMDQEDNLRGTTQPPRWRRSRNGGNSPEEEAERRIVAMPAKLKAELAGILRSEKLSALVQDLEGRFASLIEHGDADSVLCLTLGDGYQRLVCHCTAAYYQLVSNSVTTNGERTTVVALPQSIVERGRSIAQPPLPLLKAIQLRLQSTRPSKEFEFVAAPRAHVTSKRRAAK